MREKFIRFMNGRNGMDELARAESWVVMILLVASIFTRSAILDILAIGLMIHMYFRVFSRNVNKRYAENQIEVEPGYYLLTTSNTDKKYQQIKFISNSLNLNLKIELVDVEEARSNTPVIDNIEKSGEEVKKYPNQNRSLYSLNSGQFLNKVQFMAEVVSELLLNCCVQSQRSLMKSFVLSYLLIHPTTEHS